MANYYNEIDLFAAEWLRNLIKEGLIPDGEVDTRSISDVVPNDLAGFTQCHFFAGIAGWSHALRLAGWSEDRPIWTGSCPCQPFSVAGKGKGTADERHLWPVFFNLIRECRPPVVMGEQVAGAAGFAWFDGVASDLEAEGYTAGAFDLAAGAIGAPHIRQRLYWAATRPLGDTDVPPKDAHTPAGSSRPTVGERSAGSDMADADQGERGRRASDGQRIRDGEDARRAEDQRDVARSSGAGFWDDAVWLTGADGKARRVKPGVCLLVDGVPARAPKLRAYGNAIVPPLAAEVIKAFMDV